MSKTTKDEQEVSPELSENEIEQVQDIQEESQNWQTKPAPTPRDPHIGFDYEWNNMRRCHLCGDRSDHMNHIAKGVWFYNVEDLAKHIIECHRNFPWEVTRAREILGMDVLEPIDDSKPLPPTIKDSEIPPPPQDRGWNPYTDYLQKPAEDHIVEKNGKLQPKPKTKWNKKRIIMVGAIIVIIYLIIVGYRLSLGYTF